MSPIVVEQTAGPKEALSAAAQMAGRLSREGPRDTAGELPHLACLRRGACLASEDFWQLWLPGPWHPSVRWSLQTGGLERGWGKGERCCSRQ